MDELIERRIKNCFACMVNSPKVEFQPLKMSEMPEAPWHSLAIDFYGPTPSNTSLIELICEYSRYILCKETNSKTAGAVIAWLHEIFSTFGIPFGIKSDNGPPFNSEEFAKFCAIYGIKHRLITLYWPRANGEIEQFNRNLTKVIRNADVSGIPWQRELNFFLGSYRTTPHCSTGVPPASLIFKFSSTSRLISISELTKTESHK